MPGVAFAPGAAAGETSVAVGGVEPGAGTAGAAEVAGLASVFGPGISEVGGAAGLDGFEVVDDAVEGAGFCAAVSPVCATAIGAKKSTAAAKIGKNFPVAMAVRGSRMVSGWQ